MPHICDKEERIRKLEQSEAVMGIKVENLIDRLDKLISVLEKLVWIAVPITITLLGVLTRYWIKG